MDVNCNVIGDMQPLNTETLSKETKKGEFYATKNHNFG